MSEVSSVGLQMGPDGVRPGDKHRDNSTVSLPYAMAATFHTWPGRLRGDHQASFLGGGGNHHPVRKTLGDPGVEAEGSTCLG